MIRKHGGRGGLEEARRSPGGSWDDAQRRRWVGRRGCFGGKGGLLKEEALMRRRPREGGGLEGAWR